MSKKAAGKAPARPVTVEDDENLDDLDDVLEQFSQPPPPPKPSRPAHGPPPPPSADDVGLDDDFAAELAAGMESLMKELAAAGVEGPPPDPAKEKEMREAFEKMLIADLEGGPNPFEGLSDPFKGNPSPAPSAPPRPGTSNARANPTASSASGSSSKVDDAFQRTIKEAMDRLKTSEDTLKADAANAANPLAQLLSGLGDVGDIGDDDGEDMQGLLESMMAQLMSKELLYEPLKELDEKFPEYFTQHGSKLNPEELEKYKRQQGLISQTVKIFEQPNYSDDDPKTSAEVLKLMNEMQTLGSPPSEIMGELPPGFSLGPDGMPSMDGAEGCVIA
ncbi:Peroxisome chaperone and import receptor [Tulasnella sp. 403]|nr:Peroxisome chaperone and import receptor [Tulasnella sp. 403]